MPSDNTGLNNGKAAKDDEFYTRMEDIEREMNHYIPQFKDRVVYCNCDDPFKSNFVKYFLINFRRLGLKRLICTCYGPKGVQMSLFSEEESPKSCNAYILDVSEKDIPEGEYDAESLLNTTGIVRRLTGNGDFKSVECTEYLVQSDIVVTNPPFSKMRSFVKHIMNHRKAFLIIGTIGTFTYSELFPYVRDGTIGIGHNTVDLFVRPDGTIREFGNIVWLTTLETERLPRVTEFPCRYNPKDYPHYDNYDAIEVGETRNMPCDYTGKMGIPITAFDVMDVGLLDLICMFNDPCVNGKRLFKRLIVKWKKEPTKNSVGEDNINTTDVYTQLGCNDIQRR